ncbi:MAG: DUF2007 domain-containing protein [Bacteroidales bacterium]|nr:DUF2007 domain-containing protein [Bacteroidales bacterium]
MDKNEIVRLLSIDDRILAEDIQRLLDESGIYTLLVSDNPASSVMNAYTGLNAIERIEIQINKLDYQQAIEALHQSPYKDLV